MKYHHVQRIYRAPFFVNFKKHYCPKCGNRLKKIKAHKIVDAKSPEASSFDFHTLDNYMYGKVKFIWTEFQCPRCKFIYTIDKLKSRETLFKEQQDEE